MMTTILRRLTAANSRNIKTYPNVIFVKRTVCTPNRMEPTTRSTLLVALKTLPNVVSTVYLKIQAVQSLTCVVHSIQPSVARTNSSSTKKTKCMNTAALETLLPVVPHK